MKAGQRTVRRLLPAVLAVAVLGGAGCSGDDGSADAEINTTAAPIATGLPTAEENLKQYFEMLTRLQMTPDPDDPEIALRSTGANLPHLRGFVGDLRDEHVVARLDSGRKYSMEIRGGSIRENKASIDACIVDGLTTFRSDTGEVINDDIQTILLKADMLLVGQIWKVEYWWYPVRATGDVPCDSLQESPLSSPLS
jgi:hypothetical protein